MIYVNCKIYGPYKRKDNREHVVIVWPNGMKQTVSYPKYLTEIRIDQYLNKDETIDHIDGDFTNNNPSNIQILNRPEHATLDVRRRNNQTFECPYCSTQFTLSGRKLNTATQNRKKKNMAGPFCSKSCAGKYSKSVQLGAAKLPVEEIIPEYFTIKSKQSLI